MAEMNYEINTEHMEQLDWNAKHEQRVVQNVRNLINTWRYEVAYDRTKGLDPTILDRPAEESAALYVSEVYRLIETYEPRARIISVMPTGINASGQINIKVVIQV